MVLFVSCETKPEETVTREAAAQLLFIGICLPCRAKVLNLILIV